MASLRESSEPLIIKYLNARAAKEKIPLNLTCEITSRCNFSCRMCYVHTAQCNKNKPLELSAEQWISIAEAAKSAGTVFLLITGGEPFIRDDFSEIYEAVSKMGFVISINTNLSLLNDDIIKLFSDYPPSRVNVSLYGADNETYGNLCGVPAFDTVKSNILKLREKSIPVKINSSVTHSNFSNLEKMMEFCDGNGIAFKGTGYMFPSARLGTVPERLSPREVASVKACIDKHCLTAEDFAERARRVSAGIEFEASNECPVEDTEYGRIRCRAGSTSAWIDWRGNMSFCGMIPASENLNVITNGFEECWKAVNEKAASVRMPAKCMTCEYRRVCILCAASQYCETGGFEEPPEYICSVAKSVSGEYDKLCGK